MNNQLVLYLLLSFLLVNGLSFWSLRRDSNSQLSLSALFGMLGVAAIQLLVFGTPWSADSEEFVGKLLVLLATGLCVGLPLGAFGYFAKRMSAGSTGRLLAMVVGGSIGIAFSPIVGLTLGCALTGDCL